MQQKRTPFTIWIRKSVQKAHENIPDGTELNNVSYEFVTKYKGDEMKHVGSEKPLLNSEGKKPHGDGEDRGSHLSDNILSKANHMKGHFLAGISNEIRAPLNAIIRMTQTLLGTQLNNDQRNSVETVQTNSEVLLSLINDILDFSNIEARKIELENQTFEIRRCIEEALDLVTPKALDKKIELAYSTDEYLPTKVIGDLTRVRQILVNLLSNSVKFTENGEVVISVSGQLRDHYKYQLHFIVKDTGSGISPDRQEGLFKPFGQVDTSTTRRFGSSGLGLAISKRLCELMGGTMWLESTGIPGEGTTFHFTILTELSIEEQAANDLTHLVGKKVLIVDDNKTYREIMIHHLESWSMIPIAKASGREVLELFHKSIKFDVAVLDMQMPDMDGLMLADEIRKLQGGKILPLILLSSLGYREMESARPRFAASLTKPLKPSQLYNVLSAILNRPNASIRKNNVPQMQFGVEIGKCHPLRILLAEDNIVNQKVTMQFLEKIGYRADTAFNGIQVLEALKQKTYDVVLMDGHMPEMDGERTTIEIRKRWLPEQQPRIIAMTASTKKGDRERCLEVGMNDYLSKPVKIEDLVRALMESQPLSIQGYK